MLYYIPVIELPILVVLVLLRALTLRRQGIKALVFGVTDKTDFIIIPIVGFFFYALAAGIFSKGTVRLPFPRLLIQPFWEIPLVYWIAIILCSVSIVWFTVTLHIFGKSFRVGIDESTKGQLITGGTFAVSRNPVYLAFIVFFIGIFLAYSGICTAVFLVLLAVTIHRQILREEKFLAGHYGSEYEEYCKKTRRYL